MGAEAGGRMALGLAFEERLGCLWPGLAALRPIAALNGFQGHFGVSSSAMNPSLPANLIHFSVSPCPRAGIDLNAQSEKTESCEISPGMVAAYKQTC